MRNTETKFASIKSSNEVFFEFPYDGGSSLSLVLRKKTNHPSEIMFAISKGQYSCDNISTNCYVSFKFDENKIQKIALASASDYSSDVLFIEDQRDIDQFINQLHKSKNLIIELPFYQAGSKQFKFTVSGLKWNSVEIQKLEKSKSRKISENISSDRELENMTSEEIVAVAEATAEAAAAADH